MCSLLIMFHINPIINKPHCLDTYNFVSTQFASIKSIGSFTNFSQISGQDLITISNVTFDCLDKLSEVSSFIERKLTDVNLNELALGQIAKMSDLNNKLHEQIYLFNCITHDVALLAKDTAGGTMSQDVINYINFDIINKYKQIVFKILTLIKKINVYVELLKPKIM